MKKTLSLLLIFTILITVLAGCGNVGRSLPDWMSGRDAAMLLLANERLNAQLLKNDGDIFENGVEVMNTLARTATANLNVRYTGGVTPSVTKLSMVRPLSTVLEGDYSGKVEIKGDTFVWSGFEENNNSYDYFKNVTENIVLNAEIGADLIDDIKKNVRVVDKWIDAGDVCYYLSVSENAEFLCELDEVSGLLKICKRTRNEAGKDVYELYVRENGRRERMTYIPGERYELSMTDSQGNGEDYFVADNSKGYWETYSVVAAPEIYNVSYFIMKNDICYDAFYDPRTQSVTMLKIMSADKQTDILNFSDSESSSSVDLKFSGFSGIASVEAPASSVQYDGAGGYASLSNGDGASVHLTNGKVLKYGDSFVDGKVTAVAIHAGFIGGFGYTGEILLNVTGDSYAERLANLKSFLNETGLQCRRDIDSVLNGIAKAYADLDSVIRYYTWNGVAVSRETGIDAAIVKEKARMDDMEAIYTAVKDAEVLDISDTELIELNIQFAPITAGGFDGVTFDAMNVAVAGGSLTIEDTTLYVTEEPYKIAFALADADGKLVHFDMENTATVTYAEETAFTVTAPALTFTLPVLSSGRYTLVAYIATSDGIRASAYTPVTVSEIASPSVNVENMTVSAEKSDENGALTLIYEQQKDFAVTLTTPERIGYAEFKTAVSETVFAYGIPSDTIELQTGDGYTALAGNETAIADGTYRVAYQVENGDDEMQGYIYVQYSCGETNP